MVSVQVPITNKLGLHARAAAKLVTLASEFDCTIELARGNKKVNGKSIMGVMMLAAGQGTEVQITADGPDEQDAVYKLEQLFIAKFGEVD